MIQMTWRVGMMPARDSDSDARLDLNELHLDALSLTSRNTVAPLYPAKHWRPSFRGNDLVILALIMTVIMSGTILISGELRSMKWK
jgi:hypothetical protein